MGDDTKRCKVDNSGNDTTSCEATGKPCFVLLELGLTSEAMDCLPCFNCEIGRRDALALQGARLGKHERRVLIEAAEPDAKHSNILEPENDTRSASEALRRAMRKLQEMGLVQIYHKEQESERKARAGTLERNYGVTARYTARRAAVRTTPLGEALRERIDLTQPIRWGDIPGELSEQVILPLPDLIEAYSESVDFKYKVQKQVVGWWTGRTVSKERADRIIPRLNELDAAKKAIEAYH